MDRAGSARPAPSAGINRGREPLRRERPRGAAGIRHDAGLLAIQRTAGNRAAMAVIARSGHGRGRGGDGRGGDGRGGDGRGGGGPGPRRRTLARAPLTSPRFQHEPLLQDCADDRTRMGIGASDSGAFHPVSKIQQALLDWAAMKHVTIDLGSSGPAGNGVDGVYGEKTAAAVRTFKAREALGFETFGDVGPGTMNRLNDLFPASGPSPTPPPPTPALSPDDQKIQQAKDDREQQLRKVSNKLAAMASLVLRGALTGPGEGPVPTVEEQFPREVCVVQFWLHAKPSDPDYFDTLQKARALVERDRTASQALISRTGADCVAHPAHGFSTVGHPENGTQLCNLWFDSDSRHCRADVLIHETYHTLGSHKDGADFPAERTPDDALDNADTVTQFGNDLVGDSVDNCGATLRSGTARTTVAECVRALRARTTVTAAPAVLPGSLAAADPNDRGALTLASLGDLDQLLEDED